MADTWFVTPKRELGPVGLLQVALEKIRKKNREDFLNGTKEEDAQGMGITVLAMDSHIATQSEVYAFTPASYIFFFHGSHAMVLWE